MSSDRPTSSPQPAHQANGSTDEFGVELEWPVDELTPPTVDVSGEGQGEEDPPITPERAGADAEDAEDPEDAEDAEDADEDALLAHPEDEPWPQVRPGAGFETDDSSEEPVDEHIDEEHDTEAPEGWPLRPGSIGSRAPETPASPGGGGTAPASVVQPRSTSPVVAARPEALHGALSTLAIRIDALVGATSTNRTSITERLNDHIDTVGRLARSQIADLAEFQQVNERSLGELRRTLHGMDDVLRRLADRMERLQGDLASVQGELGEVRGGQALLPGMADDITRLQSALDAVPVDEPSPVPPSEHLETLREELLRASSTRLAAEEELTRQVETLRAALEALSEVPDEPAAGPSPGESAIEAALQRLEGKVAQLDSSRHDVDLREALARIEERLDELARPKEPVAGEGTWPAEPELRDRLDQMHEQLAQLTERSTAGGEEMFAQLQDLPAAVAELHRSVDAIAAAPVGVTVDELAAEVRGLRATIEAALAEPVDTAESATGGDVAAQLAGVSKELATLRRRISVRAKPLEVEVGLGEAQVDALADAVVARLRKMLEVVPQGDED